MKSFYKYIFLLISCILCILLSTYIYYNKPINISKNTIDSIYSENNFKYEDYKEYMNNKNNVTRKTLASVTRLTVDASNDNDFLKYTKNIEILTINNFQYLSKEDLKNIKNVKNLYLIIDGDYVLKNTNYKIDLSMFPLLEKVYITCNLPKEIDSFISYNIVKNNDFNNITFSDNISIETLKKWNKNIDNILNNLDLENKTETEKINIISSYILSTLSYDYSIYYSPYKVHEYNVKLLSSIFNNDNNIKDVICANYAAYTNILLYKANIESYYINGKVNTTNHAWNYVNIDDNYYFVDLTVLDNDNSINTLLISNDYEEFNLYNDYILPIKEENITV